MKKASIITIGDEILYGQITDTNSAWIAEQLTLIGIKVVWKVSVGDNKEQIQEALNGAAAKTDVVIITGGLGPTKDDITKATLCAFFGGELVLHKDALDHLNAFFQNRGKELSALNRYQAYLPESCRYLVNRFGTAPAMLFEKDEKLFFSLPGVPYEMKGIMQEEILPLLTDQGSSLTHKIIRTIGIAESDLSDQLNEWEYALPEQIKLAYLPSIGEVKLRLTAIGKSLEENEVLIEREVEKVKTLISDYIYSFDNISLEETVGKLLRENKLRLATAESCSGGYLAHLITSVAGSSDYFSGSVIAYSNDIKKNLLSVNEETLTKFGAVSEQTVREMAEGARKLFGTDLAVSTSGIAGPGGGTAEKPVGTVWIALADSRGTIAKKLRLGEQRELNIKRSALAVLNMIRQRIV